LVGTLTILLAVVATLRDLAVDKDQSVAVYVSRFLVMPAWGYGLLRRNVWVVRISWAIGIAMLLWLVDRVVIGPPIASDFLALALTHYCLLAGTVFIPRRQLTPVPRRKKAPDDPNNPYQPSGWG